MKKHINTRDPIEFDSLIRQFQSQARIKGFHLKKTDIKRQLASNMSDFRYDPKEKRFLNKNFLEEFFK